MIKAKINPNLVLWPALLALLCVFYASSLSVNAYAIEVAPSTEQIKAAIEKGKKSVSSPDKLFKGYDFGKRGVGANGYVMTKLFEISHRSLVAAKKNESVSIDSFKDILAKDYLLFPVYLLGGSESELGNVRAELRQGIKTIKAAEVLLDPVEKTVCSDTEGCLYKRDIYAAFRYADFDPKRLVVLVIYYGKKSSEFPLVLENFK